MEFDDEVRSAKGIAICLRDMGDGTSRFFVDDVIQDGSVEPRVWAHDWFVTFTPAIPNARVDDFEFTAAELNDIGLLVVARLVAINKRLRDRPDA